MDNNAVASLIPASSVLIIPLGTPVPFELDGAEVISGSLYARLAPLATEGQPDTQLLPVLVPLSGAELAQLTPAWDLLCTGRVGYVLIGLPGTRVDITFEHAARSIGLRVIDWQDVKAELEARVLTAQRASAAPPSSDDASAPFTDDRAGKPLVYSVDREARRRHKTTDSDVLRSPPAVDYDDEDDYAQV